jgi:hypothetical protein
MRKLKLSLFHKVSFLSGHKCQLIGVGKGMQQTSRASGSYHKYLEKKVDANKEAAEPRVLLNGSIESHHLQMQLLVECC